MPPVTYPGPLRRLARLAWHYRSELAPAWVAFALLAASLIVRPVFRGPGLGWKLTALTLATVGVAGVLWRWGGRVSLDRAIERAYAATVALAAGLWLELAVVRGPLRNSVLLAWLAGTVVGGVPWWWHRRIRRHTSTGIQQWKAGLEEHEEGSNVGRPRFDQAGGAAIPWSLKPGRTIEDIRPAVGRLESLLDLRPGAIEIEQDESRKRQVWLRIQPRDPHKQALDYPGPPRDASITRPVTIGRYLDGGPAEAPLLGLHALIAGTTGSGKSGVLNVIIAWLAACPDVVLWGCDLKHGLELGPWEPVFGRVATTPEQATVLLEALVRVQQARGEEMARRKIRTWPTSPSEPALVGMIDEHKPLAGNKRAIAAIETLTSQGRAMAVSLIDTTQYPTVRALGSELIAPQCAVKVCLRVNTPGEANVILGPGSAGAGWKAHEITKGKPGTLYLDAPGADSPRLARAFHVPDEMVARVVRTYAGRRPALDEVSERAAIGPPDGPVGTSPDSPPFGPAEHLPFGTHAWPADSPARDPLAGLRLTESDSPPFGSFADTPDGPDVWLLPGRAERTPPGTAAGRGRAGIAAERDPGRRLLMALDAAGERGAKVPELAEVVGMSVAWVFNRLAELKRGGQVRNTNGRHSLVTSDRGEGCATDD